MITVTRIFDDTEKRVSLNPAHIFWIEDHPQGARIWFKDHPAAGNPWIVAETRSRLNNLFRSSSLLMT